MLVCTPIFPIPATSYRENCTTHRSAPSWSPSRRAAARSAPPGSAGGPSGSGRGGPTQQPPSSLPPPWLQFYHLLLSRPHELCSWRRGPGGRVQVFWQLSSRRAGCSGIQISFNQNKIKVSKQTFVLILLLWTLSEIIEIIDKLRIARASATDNWGI